MVELDGLIGTQPSFDHWIPKGTTDINKQYKTCRDSLAGKKVTQSHNN